MTPNSKGFSTAILKLNCACLAWGLVGSTVISRLRFLHFVGLSLWRIPKNTVKHHIIIF